MAVQLVRSSLGISHTRTRTRTLPRVAVGEICCG